MKESELIKAARKFDRDALRTIFDSYSPAIYEYAFRLCRDDIEADNIVGDVFAILLEQLADGKGPKSDIKSHLFQITYGVINDRTQSSRRLSPMETANFTEEPAASLPYLTESEDELEAVISAMDTELTADQRQVLVLRFVEGFNVRETATIIGKTENNVKVIQNRGLEKLRQAMNQKFGTQS